MSAQTEQAPSTWWVVIRTPDGAHMGDTVVLESESDPAVWSRTQDLTTRLREQFKVPDTWAESDEWDIALFAGEPVPLRGVAEVHEDWRVA